MASQKRLPAVERRQLVASAATTLFAEHGYDGVTLDDIAAAAGVTKPIVYRHFASKRDLHLTLLGAHRDALLQTLSLATATAVSLSERIRLVATAWLLYVEERPYASRMLFRDTTGEPEFVRFHEDMRGTARIALVAILREDRTLRIPPDELEPLAELLRAGMVGLAQWKADNPAAALEPLVRAASHLFSSGIGGAYAVQ